MPLPRWEEAGPYRYIYGREQWLLVLAGEPALRYQNGEDLLHPADVVCLPEGPAGAHQLLNRSTHVLRALVLSTTGLPANTYFPETDDWHLENAPGTHTDL